MKIVIEIPDKIYDGIKKRFPNYLCYSDVCVMANAIVNGTILPKGHGALKDATTLKKMFEDKEGDDFTAFHFYEAIDECPTIIEADKEGAEK